MKITIIGYSGSGKSTLAEKLSNYYSIPKLHMDTLQFQPGWQDSDCEWMLTEIKNFLTKHKAWVIDTWTHSNFNLVGKTVTANGC
ncbi:topology modulation protein [Streptococcus pneumoniae]|nr:topology modulation protein [Streptococcus pneumoniae]